VVATVTLTFVAAERLTEDGEVVQVASEGSPEHEIETIWLNPPCGVSVRVYFAEEPGLTDAVPGVAATVKSAPLPDSAKVD